MARWKKLKSGSSTWVKGTQGVGWNIPKDNKQIDIYRRKKGKNKGKYEVQLWEARAGKRGRVTRTSPFVKTRGEALSWVKKFKRRKR